MIKNAIFLDRDGTINVDHGYISEPEDFHFYPFAIEALNKLQQMGYLIFIVTNQSGIARGYYTVEKLQKIHAKMLKILNKNDIQITEIFSSPYHPEGIVAPYGQMHEDRKPGLGLFKKALQRHTFRINSSFMIGDKYTDIAFGKKAGLKTILVLTGEGEKEFYLNRSKWKYKPDFVAENLLTAVKLISHLEITENR